MKSESIKIVEAAKDLLKLYGYFVDNLWHVDDVHFICEQHQWEKITHEEALEVFAIANDQFDGDTGISWPKLEEALKLFLRSRAILNQNDDVLGEYK